MEAEAITAIVCSRDENPTHPTNQMKLFKVIVATASFVVCCIGITEAKKYYDWTFIGSYHSGDMYAKILAMPKEGSDRRVLIKAAGNKYESNIGCFDWAYRNQSDSHWTPILPGSMMDSVAKMFC